MTSFSAEVSTVSSSRHRANLRLEHERVAQLVEHRPFKALVLGSSPSPLTTTFPKSHKIPPPASGFQAKFLLWKNLHRQ